MSDVFVRTECLVHRVPGVDAVTRDEACVKCGARRQWVVEVDGPAYQINVDYHDATKFRFIDNAIAEGVLVEVGEEET